MVYHRTSVLSPRSAESGSFRIQHASMNQTSGPDQAELKPHLSGTREHVAPGNRLWWLVCRRPIVTAWMALSLALACLLAVDPLFNKPSGLITASLFTGHARKGEAKACTYNYDGSWQVGVLTGASPLTTTVSPTALLSCATMSNQNNGNATLHAVLSQALPMPAPAPCRCQLNALPPAPLPTGNTA